MNLIFSPVCWIKQLKCLLFYICTVLATTDGNWILNGNRSVMKDKRKIQKRQNEFDRGFLYDCDYTGTLSIVEKINCTKALKVDLVVEVCINIYFIYVSTY